MGVITDILPYSQVQTSQF